MERRGGRLLIVQKHNSLPKLFPIYYYKSDYPVMHSFILVNQFSSIGALFAAWKVALHFLIR